MRPSDNIDELIDIERALVCLTTKQREAFVMWMTGYTMDEVGLVMGITQQAVSKLIKLAQKRLLKQL